ncbi:DUF4292 domain-containing protein [Dokdonia sp. Hel_I_53]|uniref:DUF4292 domain-containing protein n=1 Tax=Dokdonia sp. Hel_I_53 TaxID=1566287 RepID=UPI00119AC4A0|nr:DUF4292 domain-containing protein [Dokdonia sp. Hel_I_53]TVZ52737.1 uncharacterized protein DUF4292 [Dokdonia sp. Hel_I_53]
MKKYSYLFIFILLASCSGTKKIATSESAEDITSSRLINEYYANALEYKTMDARTRLRYEDKNNSQSVTVTIRIEKDKKIWLNASLLGISGARALITPDKVQFYDKLNRQYFEGDFRFLSEYLGVDIDFFQLQRLLSGQTVYDLREGKYDFKKTAVGYTITPRKQLEGINLLFSISSENFMVDRQRVEQPAENVSLDVVYGAYRNVEGKPFPTQIDILANDNQNQTRVSIDFRDIDINVDTNFPFSIPSGYSKIELHAR